MSMIFSSDDTDFAQYYADTEPAVKVHSATTWTEQLEALADIPARLTGAKLPWKSTHDYIRFRPGEVTLWAGINGSGKSQLVGNVVLGFCAQQETSCIASFEMAPLSTLGRMQRQAAMCSTPAREFTKRFMGLLENRLWIYDQQGTVDPRMLYAVIRYCGRKLGVKHMVVDNLAKCVRGADDYTGEKVFIDVMTALARDEGMHIHVVHHIKKAKTRTSRPPSGTLRGPVPSSIQVDQLLIVWRNKLKERAIQKLAAQGEPVDDETYLQARRAPVLREEPPREWEDESPLVPQGQPAVHGRSALQAA